MANSSKGRLRIKGWLGVGGLVVGTLTAAMGFLHTPSGLRLWGQLTGAPCPLSGPHTALSPRQLDAAYGRAARLARGKVPAKSQYALDFELKHTSRNDLKAWAVAHGIPCQDSKEGIGVSCDVGNFSVMPQTLFLADSGWLSFRFDSENHLRSVTAMQKTTDVDLAAQTLAHWRERLEKLAGPSLAPQDKPLTAQQLRDRALAQDASAYRFADYAADVSVTNMGKMGYYSMRQTYTSLQD